VAPREEMRARRIGSALKRRPPAERLNPEVIRAFLHELVTIRFGRDVTAAAQAIDAARPKPGRKGHYRSDFRAETLYDLIQDRARIKYYHLEAVSHFYNMPVSVLLLFTRLRSELEDSREGLAKARDIIRATRRFLDRVEDAVASAEKGDLSTLRSNSILSFDLFEQLAILFPKDVTEQQRVFPFL